MNNTAKDLEAMMHSVELINRLILLPTLDDEQKMMLVANISHLEIMLAKEHIIEDSSDKSVFTNAIAIGHFKI
jgi:hypothetical protein